METFPALLILSLDIYIEYCIAVFQCSANMDNWQLCFAFCHLWQRNIHCSYSRFGNDCHSCNYVRIILPLLGLIFWRITATSQVDTKYTTLFVVVPSYAVGFIYIPGKLGFVFFITVQSYDMRNWSSTLWADDHIRLFAHHTIYLIIIIILQTDLKYWTSKMLVRYILSRVCV